MERDRISRLAHRDHPIAAPFGDDAVRGLLTAALAGPAERKRVLDLGCGGGEWLLRLLELDRSATAVGVDVSAAALEHAREAAGRRGVADRLSLHRADASAWAGGGFDVVLSVGATHAFGGLLPTLGAAASALADGGRVLVGEGFWAAGPTGEAVGMLGELAGLADTMAAVAAAGWIPLHGHVSTREELDAYEWAWTGSLADWAVARRGTPDGEQALAVAREHLAEWLRGYRDSFGFLGVVLCR